MDIQYDFAYITKKLEIITDKLPIHLYINKIENTNTFRIRTEYILKPLILETMTLPESKKKHKKGEYDNNVPQLEIK